MERTFIWGWSKGTYYMPIIAIVMVLPIIWIFLIHIPVLGIGFLSLFAFLGWLQYMVIHNSKYIVTDKEIVVEMFWTKPKKYLIDKIQRIEYVDLGTDWGRNSPSARFQFAIYFERRYLKSVEPRLFGPADRNSFVATLLEINPNITVVEEEIKI